VTPLQHVQNERYRMMRSPVTTDQKWMNRNLVIFPPFSTPQGGERGANQNVPLTANSSQVPVECVGILGGGQAPTLFREYSPPKIQQKKTFRRFLDQSLGHADTSSPRWVPNGINRKRTQGTPERKSHGTGMDQVRKNYEKNYEKKNYEKKDTIYGKKLISRNGIC
jgi:hypothetical protein